MISATALMVLVVTALVFAAATPVILLVLFFLDVKAKEIW